MPQISPPRLIKNESAAPVNIGVVSLAGTLDATLDG